MAIGALHQVSAAIGGLAADVAMLTRMVTEDRRASAEYRTDVRKQLGDLHDQIAPLAAIVEELKPQVAALAKEHIEAAVRARTARWLGRGLWAMFMALFAAAAAAIATWPWRR